MFCYQCEQTSHGKVCDKIGVCSKDETTSNLQDLLVYTLRGLSLVAEEGRKVGVVDAAVDRHLPAMLFSTLTNVNFNPERFKAWIKQTVDLRESLKGKVKAAGGAIPTHASVAFAPAADLTGLIAQASEGKGGMKDNPDSDADIVSLQHMVLFGLKGLSAYADHANILGVENKEIYDWIHESMAAATKPGLGMDWWFNACVKTGQVNLLAMEALDKANTETYGHPKPTAVTLGQRKNKAILITGHDLKDLEELLKQTQGKGIDVYTHGEMLPCHGYPKLKETYPHLYGHFGTAWQNQQKEFAQFPGAILFTTNCLMKPAQSYADNVFTHGLVGFPGIKHVETYDFSPVIEHALKMPGFTADVPGKQVLTGFARNAVLGVADKVIEAVKSGAIKRFFLVAGCDGAKPGRNYYTEFVEKLPKDTVVLTLACGKFRFFDKDLGDIGGIPRLLDMGQCNDAYSAIQVAVALANAFNCGVNDLPLSMILSWYEQKAVAILLTLVALGIKDIRLGPTLPAFVTPNVLKVLVDKLNIMPITTPDQDIKAILG
ncbi:hydroxylamine reductase [Fundidesulfovibrio terrae]|uniref:hydroxylamine reductase n=1 Tax=Fundidesulfovibrio terrae TaxID=2922866 RepID=UPI001FAF729B|nr:hydroxylamine reductase [Fundidesulfovibrio terrae]